MKLALTRPSSLMNFGTAYVCTCKIFFSYWHSSQSGFSNVHLGHLCNRPMGLQNNRLKNHQMTSSSRWDNFHGPYRARLNIRRHGRHIGAWSSQYNNRYQWLQVDFRGPAKIIRICTQGRQDTNQWVTQYFVMHSLTAVNFVPYQERNSIKVIGTDLKLQGSGLAPLISLS